MGWFRRTTARDSLPVTMTGVKLGDRFLSIGARDPALIAALATKAGLTGRSCAVDADPKRAADGAGQIEAEGALVEVSEAPWDALPFDGASFDVALVRDVAHSLPLDQLQRSAGEILRVLRGGGRVMVIEPRKRADAEAIATALRNAGFAAVRVLAEAEGQIFVEGIKKA